MVKTVISVSILIFLSLGIYTLQKQMPRIRRKKMGNWEKAFPFWACEPYRDYLHDSFGVRIKNLYLVVSRLGKSKQEAIKLWNEFWSFIQLMAEILHGQLCATYKKSGCSPRDPLNFKVGQAWKVGTISAMYHLHILLLISQKLQDLWCTKPMMGTLPPFAG